MRTVTGERLGREAAERLADLGTVQVGPGLTAAEFDAAEARFGFVFADDHRAFLAAGMATGPQEGWGFPDWRDLHSPTLRAQVDHPVDSALRSVRAGWWSDDWGRRPRDTGAVLDKARRELAKVPRMVPVYSHRYLPEGRGTYGHPVLSIHEVHDTIVYGLDLIDYVWREFREPEVTVPFWWGQW